MTAKKPRLKVMQVRGVIGCPGTQRDTIKGLGLRGRHHSVVVDNTPAIRGMIKKVMHLVKVEEVDE